MAIVYDAQGNEQLFFEDILGGVILAEARSRTGSLGALNAEIATTVNGQQVITIDARSAAFAGTISVEGSIDGTNYWAIPFLNDATQAYQATAVLSGATSNVWKASVAGYNLVRVRCSAYTSGTLTVAVRVSQTPLRSGENQPYPTLLWVTATAAANTAATASLPAGGAGMFHYITHIDITRNATAALAGSATIIHTTSNIAGSPAWSVGNNMVAGGTEKDVFIDFANPLKSSVANTATTVVAAAAGAAVLGRVNVGYYLGF
jgi:hypothetical protein